MRAHPRLIALASFVVVGMVSLIVAGLLDWIVGILFLAMEFLGEVVRSAFRTRRERRHSSTRVRHVAPRIRRRARPRRKSSKRAEIEPAPDSTDVRRLRILVPVSVDEPDLLAFAIEECRTRHAEMILLFLRPLAVMPMGPTALPGLAEDDEARETFDRVGLDAGRAGVPLRTLYATTADVPATIGEFARESEADVVLVGSTRRAGFARFLSRDPTPSILKMLPEHASLTIRAS